MHKTVLVSNITKAFIHSLSQRSYIVYVFRSFMATPPTGVHQEVQPHLSWASLVRLALRRRAILDLQLALRAGPTLMEVFSKGVAQIDTLLPL